MKLKTIIAIAVTTALLAGCKNINTQMMAQSGAQAVQAATLSDDDAKAIANKSCKEMDSQEKYSDDRPDRCR